MPAWQALLLGFIRSTSSRSALLVGWAYISCDWVAGLVWFLGKTLLLVFVFVWMRGTLPAGPHRPADGLRLEVAAAGVPAQPVRDRGRDRRDRADEAEPMSLIPGLGIVQGHGPDVAQVLRAQGDDQVPGGAGRRRAQVPRPPPAAVRRVRHAEVRDVLPVRPGLPHRVHRHGRHRHQGPLPRPLGPARDSTASGARNRRCAAPAGRCRTRRTPTSRASTSAPLDEILARLRPRPEAACSRSSRRPRTAYGYLPVAALKHISGRQARGTRCSTAPRRTTATCGSSRRPPAARPRSTPTGATDGAGRRRLPRRDGQRRSARRRAGRGASPPDADVLNAPDWPRVVLERVDAPTMPPPATAWDADAALADAQGSRRVRRPPPRHPRSGRRRGPSRRSRRPACVAGAAPGSPPARSGAPRRTGGGGPRRRRERLRRRPGLRHRPRAPR